jgi:hypothetical protein
MIVTMRWRIVFVLLVAMARPAAADDIYSLAGGDRITGRTLLETKKAFRVRTAYGVLTIPRDNVLTRQREGGTVESVSGGPPPLPSPSASPARPPARIEVTIRGSAFWLAWEPRMVPADPRLRLHLALDDQTLADYVDGTLDPDLPGAVVNTFSLVGSELLVQPAAGVKASRPALAGTEARLVLELPADVTPGDHRLRIAYQADGGSADAPAWQDRVSTGVSLDLAPGRTASVAVRQDRGSMEYAKKRMKAVETFVLDATAGNP